MCEGERCFRTFRARDDYSHPLCLLDDGEKFVDIDLADGGQKFEVEAAPDHCSCRQRLLFILVEALEAAADDQPHAFRYFGIGDLDVCAELAGLIEDLPLFDEIPVHLFDEEWISLAFLKDEAHQAFRSFALAQPMQHLRDRVL